MNLYTETKEERYYGYGTSTKRKLKKCTAEQAMHHFCSGAGIVVVDTVVKKRWWNSDHLMVLDVDSKTNLERTQLWLKAMGITFGLIESSRDHYWVVTNVVAKISKIKEMMSVIPGVDQEFIAMCDRKYQINIRACPKLNALERPIFHEFQYTNPLAGAWFESLKEFYNSPYYDAMALNFKLRDLEDKQRVSFKY